MSVLVYIEQRDGKIRKASFEALTAFEAAPICIFFKVNNEGAKGFFLVKGTETFKGISDYLDFFRCIIDFFD